MGEPVRGAATEPFRISASTYFRVESGKWITRLWAIWLLILLASAVASVYDIRFGLLGLMALFLIMPFAVFHIYYNKLLNAKAVAALALKRVSVNASGDISVTYLADSPDPDASPTVVSTEVITADKIADVAVQKGYIVVATTDRKSATLIIPKKLMHVDDFNTLIDLR